MGIPPSLGFSAASTQRALETPIKGAVSIESNLNRAALNEQVDYEKDSFWIRPSVDIKKWDKYCPYQLLIVKAVPDNTNSNKLRYQPYGSWQYTLPLPPESMSIDTPFAITTTVTQDGIVEEHNNAPLRQIHFRGTTGFLPLKETGATRTGTGPKDQLESIFAGTVNTVRSSLKSGITAAQQLTNSAPQAYNVYQEAIFTNKPDSQYNALVNTSGFKQIALLRDFLEHYAAIKKNSSEIGSKLRLAVAIWKEDQVFLVTPNRFAVHKDVSSPLEYKYELSFTAWKRIKLDVGDMQPVLGTPAIRHSPNLIARALNTITAARQALQKISTLKQAVLGDIDYVFKPFDDAVLLLKDIHGAELSVQDLPKSIAQRLNSTIHDLKHTSPSVWWQLSSSQTSDSSSQALKHSLTRVIKDVNPVNRNAFAPSTNKTAATSSSAGTRATKIAIKDLPPGLAAQISVSSLGLSPNIKNDIANNIKRVRSLRRKDFEDYANQIRVTADKVAFLVGAGDPTYADTYGIDIASIKATTTQDDWTTLKALDDSILVMQQLAATSDGEPEQSPTFLEQFGNQSRASGIAWTQPVSKFAIPFPYGATLEGLAVLYLNDPNRANEIVALNGLRAPYVDEIGYSLPLLVNGKESTVVVNSSDDLFVGKTVWLSSRATNRSQFKIIGISSINGVSNIKLSGTVDSYRVADGAVLEGFLTATVNSRNLIWIPSDRTPSDTESIVTKDVPGIDALDPMVNIGGVDLLLDATNDLVLVDNELRYAAGLANIIQWVKYVFVIEKGELIQHRNVGLPLSIGLSLADFNAQDVVTAVKDTLEQDSTFSRVDSIVVTQDKYVVTIKVSVVVAGTSMVLPLTYSLNLS